MFFFKKKKTIMVDFYDGSDNHCTNGHDISSSVNYINSPGFEISDVLKIDDKDYAITFSLYFRYIY